MDYRYNMKRLKKRRREYFPVFEMLLAVHTRKMEYEFPLRIESPADIALILELVDIGYLDADSFITRKNRRDITALFYNGEYPLTEDGAAVYRHHLLSKRGLYVKFLIALSFIILVAFLAMLVFR